MLRRLTDPPPSELILTAATVQTRLGLPAVPTAEVEEASAILTAKLGYSPAYSEWEEDLPPTARGSTVYLSARPVSLFVSLSDPAGGAIATGDYTLDLSAASIERALIGWRWFSLTGPIGYWKARYWAGWWLETMSGTRPATAPLLPLDLRRAFLLLAQQVYQEHRIRPAGVSSMGNEGASISFLSDEKAQAEIDRLIAPYRIPAIA